MEFDKSEDAEEAVRQMNNSEFKGHPFYCELAKHKRKTPQEMHEMEQPRHHQNRYPRGRSPPPPLPIRRPPRGRSFDPPPARYHSDPRMPIDDSLRTRAPRRRSREPREVRRSPKRRSRA